ncbi:MAG: ABC transporter ATP-binding protein [Actinomycetota bacterium]
MTSAPAIVARTLTKRFGAVRALDGLTLQVERGEILGLVGPNGAGKTTFILAVASLIRPDAGSIEVLGRPPGRDTAAEIGYMTQTAALYDDLTVTENLDFFGRVYGLDADATRRRSRELLGLTSLEDKAGEQVHNLSGGQRQLANLVCSMVHDPELLLLDEPTVGIDPELRRALWVRFGELRDAGATILVTTHVLEEAERCDRVAFVADGRVTAIGTTAELLERAGVDTIEEAFVRIRKMGDPSTPTDGGTP